MLGAVRAGHSTRADIVAVTGLAPSTVDAILFHLQRTGHMVAHTEAICGGRCSACATGCSTGCGPASGLRTLTLSRPARR
ncbi:hypothetical protein C1Y63_01240 [Corynebacterium sp. 13CS0277]|nr:hypothetical protein C1Y63_01240 [Corynebacterium sp. 13CS0277]